VNGCNKYEYLGLKLYFYVDNMGEQILETLKQSNKVYTYEAPHEK
jgi:hypothetical protein